MENIGNGLKTIYARFSDIAMGETLDDDVDLGKVTGTLSKVGVDVLDSNGKMRDVGNIMEDLMGVWEKIDQTQKNAIATTLAGKYQLSRFEALMNRSDLYSQYKSASQNADGTLDIMNDKYIDSVTGKLNVLQSTWEGIINQFVETDDMRNFIDGLTQIVNLMGSLVSAAGGGSGFLTMFGSMAVKAASGGIARSVNNMSINRRNKNIKKSNFDVGQDYLVANGMGEAISTRQQALAEKLGNIRNSATDSEESQKQANDLMARAVQLDNELLKTEEERRTAILALNASLKEQYGITEDLVTIDKSGNVDRTKLTAKINSGEYLPRELEISDKKLQNITSVANNFGAYSSLVGEAYGNFLEGNSSSASNILRELGGANNYIGKGLTDEQLNRVNVSIEKMKQLLIDANGEVKNLDAFTEENAKEFERLRTQVEAVAVELEEAAKAAGEVKDPLQALNDSDARMAGAQGANESLDNIISQTEDDNLMEQRNQAIINITSSIAQMGFAIQSVQNLGSIWKNDDLSEMEKIVQTLMSLSMVVGSVFSVFSTGKEVLAVLKNLWAFETGEIVLASEATAENTALENANTVAHQRNANAIQADAVATGEEAASTAAANAVNSGGQVPYSPRGGNGRRQNRGQNRNRRYSTNINTNGSTQVASQTARTAATAGAEAAATAGTAAAGAARSFSGLGATLKVVGKVFTKFLGPIGAVITAIGVVSFAAEKLSDWWNADSISADKAATAAEQASAAYEKAKQSQENLTSSLNSYDESRQSLGELEKGTEEWNEKLRETNELVLNILDNFPELAKYITTDSNGMLTFDENGIEAYKQELQNRTDKAQMSAVSTEIGATKAQNEADMTDLGRKMNFGTLGLGSVTKEEIQKIFDYFDENGTNSILSTEDLKKIPDFYDGLYDDKLEAVINKIDDVVSLYNNSKKNDAANALKLENVLSNKVYSEASGEVDQKQANNIAQVLYDQYFSKNSNERKEAEAQVSSISEEERAKQYAESMGYKANFTKDGENYVFKDSEGNDQEITIEGIDDFLVSSKLMDEAAKNWKIVADKLQNVINNSQLTDLVGSDSSTDILSNFSSENQSINVGQFSETDKSTLLGMANDNEGISAKWLGVDDEYAKKRGFEDAEAYAKAFTEKIKESLSDKQSYIDSLQNALDTKAQKGDEYNAETDDNIVTADKIQSIEQLNNAQSNGVISATEYNEALIKIGKGISGLESETKDVTEAQNKYNKMVKQYGKDSDKAKDALEDWTKSQKKLEAAITLKKFQDMKKDILDYIDVIQTADEGSEDYSNAIEKMIDILSDMSGIDLSSVVGKDVMQDFLSDTQNLDDLKKALDGDYEAYMRLRVAASEEIKIDIEVDSNPLEDALSAIRAYALSGEFATFEAGATLDGTPVFDTISKIITSLINAGKDVSSILNSLEAMGIEAEVEYEEVPMVASGAGTEDGSYQIMRIAKGVKYKKTGPDINSYSPSGNSSSSGGSSGGGSGGSGSGGSSYTPKTKDKNEDEIDRYKRVNAQLDKISNALDKINTEKDRLTGYKWQNQAAKEIKLLNRQVELQQEKLDLQKEEAEEKRKELADTYGISFDSEGIPNNYQDIFHQLQNSLNDAIDSYNNDTTEEGQEYWEDIIEERQEAFDDFKDLIDDYIDVQIDGINESEKNIQDYYDKIEDIRIEAFKKQTQAVENLVDVEDAYYKYIEVGHNGRSDSATRKAREIINEVINRYTPTRDEDTDSYFDKAIAAQQKRYWETDDQQEKENAHKRAEELRRQKALSKNGEYAGLGTGKYLEIATRGDTLLSEWHKNDSGQQMDIYGENTEELRQSTEEWINDLSDASTELEQNMENLVDAMIDKMDEVDEIMQDRLDKYDEINERLDHQANVIEAVHGEQAYDALNELYTKQNEINTAKIAEVKTDIAYWQDVMKLSEEGSEQWKAANEKAVEAQKTLDELVETSLENVQKIYNNITEKALSTWRKNIFGDSDIDWISDQWEMINRNADYYLDDTNKAYNIQKLQSKYLDLLDDASGLSTQNKITEQMNEQLQMLREKTKLSQYDVDYANAQLEILQKQIALEDAQRNKSQMKLRRDSQGNYSYVYTANEDDVRSAEDDLLDSENSAYNLAKNARSQSISDALSAIMDANSKISDIKNNVNLSKEEIQKRTQEILDNLNEYLSGVREQFTKSQQDTLDSFVQMVESLATENKDGLDEIAENIKNGNDEAFTAIDNRYDSSLTSWLTKATNFEEAQKDLLNDFLDAANVWEDDIKNISENSGQDFDNVTEAINNADSAMDNLNSSTKEFSESLKTAMNDLTDWQGQLGKYQKLLASLGEENSKLRKTIDELHERIEELETTNSIQAEVINTSSSSSGSGGSGSSDSSSSVDPSSYRAGDFIGYTGNYYNDSWGQSPVGNWYSGEQGAVRISSFSGEPYGNNSQTGEYSVHIETPDGGHLGWIRPNQMFDTGGYTGFWNDNTGLYKNGKIAMLHQKELVLNETDTANILAAVEMIRSMTESIKFDAFNSVMSRIKNQSASLVSSNDVNDLEQNIHIDANFPNVKDASEIEQAILSLADQATQYVNKIR